MITIILQKKKKKKKEMDKKFDPSILFLKPYKYNEWYKKDEEKSKSQPKGTIAEIVKLRRQKSDDEDLSDMPPQERDEELKEGKGLKVLTPKKILTRLPILLAQVKAGNNSSYKLENEIRQILYPLYQHNKITKNVDNQVIIIMEENMIVIRGPKTFYFHFDWPKDVDENLKHEAEFIVKSNESLVENKIKIEIEQ